jgi:hypothetical protein
MPRRLLAAILCLPFSLFAADQLPKLTAETLSGQSISLPGDPKIAVYVLALGFSQKSDKAVSAWDKRLAPELSAEPRVAYFEMPVIESAPGFVKPMILRGMRKSISPAEQARFAPLTQGEKALKKIVGFMVSDAAYVVVARQDGSVVWTSNGPVSDEQVAALKKAVADLLLAP